MSKTRHTPNLDSIDNIEMQAGQFRELSAEELEIVSGGFSWGDLLGLVPRTAPTIFSLL